MQTEEPIYKFVKGQGWVVSAEDSYTGIIGNWKVTVYARAPKAGEYHCYKGKSAEDTFNAIVNHSSFLFKGSSFEITRFSGGNHSEHHFTFEVEHV